MFKLKEFHIKSTLLFLGVLYVLHLVYAITSQRFLFADTAHFLLMLLQSKTFTTFDENRQFAHWISQAPIVALLKLGVKDINILSYVYGITLFTLYPLLVFGSAWLALSKTMPTSSIQTNDNIPLTQLVWFFISLSTAIAYFNTEFFIISESHLATALFWALGLLILFRRDRLGLILCSILILPTLHLYESFLFFGVILGIFATYRAFKWEKQRIQQICWLLVALYLFSSSALALNNILNPRDAQNFQGFASLLFFVHPFNPWLWHYPVLLSFLALGLLAVTLWIRQALSADFFRKISIFWLIACVAVAFYPIFAPTWLAPRLHYDARILNTLIPLMAMLGLVLAYSLNCRLNWQIQQRAWFIVFSLLLTQLTWHFAGTYQWSRYVQAFRQDLQHYCGLTPIRQTAIWQPQYTEMNWSWTTSIMSILLNPQTDIKNLIGVPYYDSWQPFQTLQRETPNLSDYGVQFKTYQRGLELQLLQPEIRSLNLKTGSCPLAAFGHREWQALKVEKLTSPLWNIAEQQYQKILLLSADNCQSKMPDTLPTALLIQRFSTKIVNECDLTKANNVTLDDETVYLMPFNRVEAFKQATTQTLNCAVLDSVPTCVTENSVKRWKKD